MRCGSEIYAVCTTPSLTHVIKSQERHFCRKKGACGSLEDLSKANTCHKISGTSFLPKKRRLRQPGRPQQGYYMS